MTFDEFKEFLKSNYSYMFPKEPVKNPLNDAPALKRWMVWDPGTGRSVIVMSNDRLQAVNMGEKLLGLEPFQAEITETWY